MVARRESKSLWSQSGSFVLWIAFSLVALSAFYLVIVFRIQIGPVNDAVRVFNKHILNPTMMFLDRHHWYAAILRHKGRHSAKEYSTPVTAQPTEGGFVVPLSYGESVDWLKNLRASGQATIETRDGIYTVGDPEVVDRSEALALVLPLGRLIFRLFGIQQYVKVRTHAASAEAEAS
jgi:deazaflavin-dependent oxidoreductase (nitroreductase family)